MLVRNDSSKMSSDLHTNAEVCIHAHTPQVQLPPVEACHAGTPEHTLRAGQDDEGSLLSLDPTACQSVPFMTGEVPEVQLNGMPCNSSGELAMGGRVS